MVLDLDFIGKNVLANLKVSIIACFYNFNSRIRTPTVVRQIM